ARRFMRHRLAVGSLVIFVLTVLFAFIVPLFWKYTYTDLRSPGSLPPSLAHPFGTDDIGHDSFAQVLRGLQQSIKVALSIALLASIGGALWGGISRDYRGLADPALLRFPGPLLPPPPIPPPAPLRHHPPPAAWGAPRV